tara:strand:+ start:460 stop:1056 length:597 start_codon:yes stop_codon:yes gene_type:complete
MIIECISCNKKFKLKDELLPPEGAKVRCGGCSEVWFFHPNKVLEVKEDQNNNELNKDVKEENITEKTSNDSEDNKFKLFYHDEVEMPEKDEMDKNLDNFVIDREKRKNFFSKLFGKKDRVTEAKKFLKKEAKKKNELKKPTNLRFRRLLLYLLFVLLVVLSIFLTPHRAHLEMAYPSLSTYFDFVAPIYKQFIFYFPL